ncbi:MAG: trypsin-like serine protease [Nannocystaceae bacterium]
MRPRSNPWAVAAPLSLAVVLVAAPGLVSAANSEFPQSAVCEWPTALTYGLWVGFEDGGTVLQEKSHCGALYLTNGYFVTAAHCLDPVYMFGDFVEVVRFGNHFNNNDYKLEVDVDYCVKHPGGYRNQDGDYVGVDVAICRMEEVFDLPTTPILVPTSCENDYLREQLFFVPEADDPDLFPNTPYGLGVAPVPVHVAGAGMETWTGPSGTCALYHGGVCINGNKRDVGTYLFHEFNVVFGGEDGVGARWVPFLKRFFASEDMPAALDLWGDAWPEDTSIPGPGALTHGDSGSPMYVQMGDGTWRAIGVASRAGNAYRILPYAGGGEYATRRDLFSPIPIFLPWMEATIAAEGDTTTDLTPCHEIGVVDGKETYVYTWSTACAAAVSHYALNPDDNDVPWVSGCALDEGGDDYPTTRECAGWTPPKDLLAPSSSPPSEAELWLQGALGNSVDPVPGSIFDLPIGVGVYGDETNNVMTLPVVADEKRRIFLGEGNDTLVTVLPSGSASNEVIAGPGDDYILHLGTTHDLVFPGYGADTVDTGPGDDTVVVLGGCELAAWEVYRGGSGTDTFIAPTTACELAKRGIEVSGFETFVTTAAGVAEGVCSDPNALPPLQDPGNTVVAGLIAAACP